ncbi:MAG: hypothetical protein PHT77_05565 [Bacteroidales bacterium]|nr:hypothetical protein [Bacteroidales bacterium]
MKKKHTTWPADAPALVELFAINAALLKLYPNDFALQLNAKQLAQLQKEHDLAIATAAKAEVLDAFADKILSSVSIPNDPTDGRIPSLGIDELAEIISSLRYTPTTPGTQEREPE